MQQPSQKDFDDLKAELANLKTQLAQVNSVLEKHKHTGSDKTVRLTEDLLLAGKSSIQLGDNIIMAQAAAAGTAASQAQMLLAASNKDLDKFTEVAVVGRSSYLGSYFAGADGPMDSGGTENIITVTAGGNTLFDPSKNWDSNQWDWPGGISGPYYPAHIAFTNSSGALQVKTVSTNTNNTITINETWDTTSTGTYTVFFPIVLGATFYPWRGLRLGYFSQIRGMGTGSSGFVLRNPKTSTNTGVAGTAKTVEISLDGVPYYFLVYPTSS
jgi:hypothetical protein